MCIRDRPIPTMDANILEILRTMKEMNENHRSTKEELVTINKKIEDGQKKMDETSQSTKEELGTINRKIEDSQKKMEDGERKTEELLEKNMEIMKENLSAELGAKINEINEKLDQMNKKMKEDYKESVESINTVVDDDYKRSGETIKRCCEETKESVKKIRGELRTDNNSGTKEVPENEDLEQNTLPGYDNKMEVEESPEDNSTEHVSQRPKNNEERNKIIKKTGEKKMEERRIIRPRKTRITRELIAVSYTHLDVYKRQVDDWEVNHIN